MRILYVGRDFSLIDDGGSVVARRNYESLLQLGVLADSLLIPPPSTIGRIKNFMFRESYGLTRKIRKHFMRLISNKYDFVFFDGSVYGGLLKCCFNNNIRTICFYHNVEQVYYKEKYKVTKGFKDRWMIPYMTFNEMISTTYATALVTLNERDSKVLKELYDRSADFVFPTSFEPINLSLADYSDDDYLLFVGSNFFANVEATNFILVNIAPFIKYKIVIAGNICESYIGKEIPENVVFAGRVDSLFKHYVNALAVIAPIFSGSGLKTKTVEALRYGKTVVGTDEAFQGIEFNEDIGFKCNTSEEFINVINSAKFEKYNIGSHKLFDRRYSNVAQVNRLKVFLSSL